MNGKPIHSLWPMALLLAAMVAVVGVATARRAGETGKAEAAEAQAGAARPTIRLPASPAERPKLNR